MSQQQLKQLNSAENLEEQSPNRPENCQNDDD